MKKIYIYKPETAYDYLNEHEGEHEGFEISANFGHGGWQIEGDISIFEEWLREKGYDGEIQEK